MKSTHLITACLFVCLGLQITAYAEVQVLLPGYKAELWMEYEPMSSSARAISFDTLGNIYVSYREAGVVSRITTSKVLTKSWASGLGDPWNLVYTGGTAYGEKVFVGETTANRISTLTSSGARTTYCGLSATTTLALDDNGSYGGYLYAATAVNDGVYRVNSNGTTSIFCSSFLSSSVSIEGLAFDPGTAYGGKMYISNFSSSVPGIYAINTDGSSQLFCNSLGSAKNVAFDEVGLFGGNMYAAGYVAGDYWKISQIDAMGNAVPFITESNYGIATFAFGPDGAMYLHDYTTTSDQIWKITPIPEPATMLLFGLGLLGLRCRKR